MIVDLPSTTTAQISKRLVSLRQDVGAMALSRVLTLVLVADESDIEDAVTTANDASHQHPCRIVAIGLGNKRGTARIDAQIRVGGEAGASEVVLLRLYGPLVAHARSVVTPLLLPDSPVVVWWPKEHPKDPAADPVGAMGQRRITDTAATDGNTGTLKALAKSYADGDTDLAWSRITLWRGLLATALDRPPFEPVTSAVVTGAADSPSADLLAGWLQVRLRCPVSIVRSRNRSGLISVRLERASGAFVDIVRPHDGDTATLSQTGQPERAIALPHRSNAECLSDELSRLDPDEVYEDAITKGLPKVTMRRTTMSKAIDKGEVPSPAKSRKDAQRIEAEAALQASSAMVVEATPEAKSSEPKVVKKASRRKLAAKADGPAGPA